MAFVCHDLPGSQAAIDGVMDRRGGDLCAMNFRSICSLFCDCKFLTLQGSNQCFPLSIGDSKKCHYVETKSSQILREIINNVFIEAKLCLPGDLMAYSENPLTK